MIHHIRRRDPDYPPRLTELGKDAPPILSVEGLLRDGSPRVAIVGSREAHLEYVTMVKRIAGAVAAAGGVVISGGAKGIDTAAHEGALAVGGTTWSVLGCGAPVIFPEENRALFANIVARGGALIRPFPDGTPTHRSRFIKRNGVLVALADVVVIAQAGLPSGTFNAAHWAAELKRPLWVALGAPWHIESIEGSWQIFDLYQPKQLRSEAAFLREVLRGREALEPPPNLTRDELSVVEALGWELKHPDELSAKTGLDASAVASTLLTLSLGDVVVEGPPGLYRRKKSP